MFSGIGKKLCVIGLGLMLSGLLGACGGAIPAGAFAALPSNVEVSDSGNQVSFSGQIQAMAADGWTVEGVSFTVNSSTEIKGDFAVGDQVKVHLTLDQSSGTVVATVIEPAGDPQLEPTETSGAGDDLRDPTEEASSTREADSTPGSEDYEFVGVVSAMGSGSWTIDGKTVTITDQTEIKDSVAVGDTVKVEAQVSLDGTITAKEIGLASAEDMSSSGDSQGEEKDGIEIKIHGTVEAYSSSSISVNGQTIALMPSTEIDGVLSVGADVVVEAYMTADGTLNAKSIEVNSGSAVETSTETENETEMEDSSDSQEHHDGSGSGGSESDSEGSHDGSGGHSDD